MANVATQRCFCSPWLKRYCPCDHCGSLTSSFRWTDSRGWLSRRRIRWPAALRWRTTGGSWRIRCVLPERTRDRVDRWSSDWRGTGPGKNRSSFAKNRPNAHQQKPNMSANRISSNNKQSNWNSDRQGKRQVTDQLAHGEKLHQNETILFKFANVGTRGSLRHRCLHFTQLTQCVDLC